MHEEAGAFETARTLRAAHDVAAKELERRNREWDALPEGRPRRNRPVFEPAALRLGT